MNITNHLFTNPTISSTISRKKKRNYSISLDWCSSKRAIISYQLNTYVTDFPRSVSSIIDTSIRYERHLKDNTNYKSSIKQGQIIKSTQLLKYADKYPYTDVKSLLNYSSHMHENLDTTGTTDAKTDTTLHLEVKADVVKTMSALTEAIVDERVSTVLKTTDAKTDTILQFDVDTNAVKTELYLTQAIVDERVSG